MPMGVIRNHKLNTPLHWPFCAITWSYSLPYESNREFIETKGSILTNRRNRRNRRNKTDNSNNDIQNLNIKIQLTVNTNTRTKHEPPSFNHSEESVTNWNVEKFLSTFHAYIIHTYCHSHIHTWYTAALQSHGASGQKSTGYAI